MTNQEQKHVFISYLRENQKDVDRLCDDLERRGVRIWLDRKNIKPGVRWKDAIRQAINQGNFFIACFSSEYSSRERTFMNEELVLAVDVLRQVSTDRVWFIPVLLSECDVPARSIGGDETLLDIQFVSLFENYEEGIRRILEIIKPIPLKIQSLIQTLRSPNLGIKRTSAIALGELGDSTAVPALIEALKDENIGVRMEVVTVLGKLGGPTAVPVLIKALNDKSEYVRSAVARALGKIREPK